jgi:uncharacterized protein (DUF427 family)
MRSSDSKPKPPANVGFTTPPSVLPESRQISWIFDHQILAETKFQGWLLEHRVRG